MFIHKPVIRNKPKRGRKTLKGSYLILMKNPRDKHIRGLVRMVSLEQYPSGVPGAKVHIAGWETMLIGRYGLHGLPISAPDHVYDLGIPLPDVLKELWGCIYSSSGADLQDREMGKWGVAVKLVLGNNPPKGCYRCGRSDWITDNRITPCPDCQNEIKAITAKLTGKSYQEVKPADQIIAPEGIESEEGVGKQ